MNWFTENWQTLAAGAIVLVAFLSIARRVQQLLHANKHSLEIGCSNCPKSQKQSSTSPNPPVIQLQSRGSATSELTISESLLTESSNRPEK